MCNDLCLTRVESTGAEVRFASAVGLKGVHDTTKRPLELLGLAPSPWEPGYKEWA